MPCGSPRCRSENNIKNYLQSILDWFDLAQDMDKRRAVVDAVMNIRVP